jgi:hypothetical protein
MAGVKNTLCNEAREFIDSITSAWEEYCAARPQRDNPPQSILDGWAGFHFDLRARWNETDPQLAEFISYVKEKGTTPQGRIRAENLDWFLTDMVMPRLKDPSSAWRVTSEGYDVFLSTTEILESLSQKKGRNLSCLEKIALGYDKSFFGQLNLLFGLLYVIFHLLIITLSFTSLRAMSDSVYDTTWARNIPSVQ